MMVKTQEEIRIIAEGGKLLGAILEDVVSRIREEVTGHELAEFAARRMQEAGGKPAFVGYGTPPYPAALCVSLNNCVVHGIPSDYAFQPGDIISLDIGMIYQGLYTDMARTVSLEPITQRERELIDTASQALDVGISEIRPGNTTGDIGYAIQQYVEGKGFGVVRDLAGHGVGHALHEKPEITNFGTRRSGTKLKTGMVLAVEPMITLGDWHVRIARDGWSVMTADGSKAAHAEDTIVVTDSGYEILTR
ncbi:MAG: type I methionyl aminopeptidase [Candidatus Komeilibacteria bacterium RIFCSPLOWO2_01_FULL_53_11]|uniref:Methionine aminopeptidase n=1 Tax=Candidatus Komeilibacteria bacterium RIFCSPLOWO2_01_FULL_53_11 TaxID=1798552 RepID=A0A1G2BUQ3_9BACT|nr:MAG: type I methionyl aminopeptidase [Candidatus Komeilibacteria bacterium RIFCSPLOWO2_01_FULL_53_11]